MRYKMSLGELKVATNDQLCSSSVAILNLVYLSTCMAIFECINVLL